jgi:aspartate racemase
MQINDQTFSNYTPKIGLIGGLALRAGVFYYEQILKNSIENDKSLRLVFSHAEVNIVLAHVTSGNIDELGKYLGGLANELFDAGAENVSVTAVAPHFAIKEIKKIAKGPIISALASVASTAKSEDIHRVAVFGNKAVMATDIFGAVPENMVVRLSPEEQEKVHDTYMDIALHGKRGTIPEVEYLNNLADDIMSRHGVNAIVLAGTDLSSFYAEQPPEYPHLDMARLHIKQILTHR